MLEIFFFRKINVRVVVNGGKIVVIMFVCVVEVCCNVMVLKIKYK